MVDSAGEPTVTLANINVSLTSSEEYVGTITSDVVIPAGETYAIANFTTTHTAGVTTITANHDRAREHFNGRHDGHCGRLSYTPRDNGSPQHRSG